MRGDRERDVGLAGVGGHRRDVGERGGQRAVPDVLEPRRAVTEQEMHALGHRVDARDREGARADDRGVVADPADHARRARLHELLEGRDQLELAHRMRQRWR